MASSIGPALGRFLQDVPTNPSWAILFSIAMAIVLVGGLVTLALAILKMSRRVERFGNGRKHRDM